MFLISETASTVLLVFAIAAVGYLAGEVKIRGVNLGGSAIFLAALVQAAGTDDVASIYATTYPIALINMVLVMCSFWQSCGPSEKSAKCRLQDGQKMIY